MRVLAQDQDEGFRQRRVEIASIWRELEEIAEDIRNLRREGPLLVLSELRKYGYNPDEPRVPKHSPGGGQWTIDGTVSFSGNANDSANDRSDSSASGSADDGNQSNVPNIHVAASGGLRCDGFPGGCQSGGSYGSSGMYYINGRVLCMDCAVKYFGLQDDPPSERIRFLGRFLIGK